MVLGVVVVVVVVVVVFVVVVLAVVAAVSGQLGPQCQFAHGREELQKVPRKHTCDFLTPALPLGERIWRDFRGCLYVLCSTVSVTSDKPNLLPISGNLYLGSCHLFPKSMSGWRIIMINLPDNLLQTVWKQNSETGLQRFQHFKLHARKIVGLLPARNNHHQDYYSFSRGIPTNLHLPQLLGASQAICMCINSIPLCLYR